MKRVELGSARPLLLGNVRGRIKTLLDERTPIYESVATLVVDTDGRSAEDVAQEIAEARADHPTKTRCDRSPRRPRHDHPGMSDTVLRVEGAAPYDVVIGSDVADRLPRCSATASSGSPSSSPTRWPGLVKPVLAALGTAYDVTVLPIPDGERAKGIEVAAACWDALGEAASPADAIVTFGGGATTDLGGFVAATWLRGVRVVHAHDPARDGRRRRRRQDRGEHPQRQEPGRLLPRAGGRAVRRRRW